MVGGNIINSIINAASLVKWLIVSVVIVVLILVFLGVPLMVSGQSMEPNFQSGEMVLVQRLSYSGDKEIRRGDVVAAKFPADSKKTRLIKRVIGLPGETVYVDGEGNISINDIDLTEPYNVIAGLPPYNANTSTVLGEDQYFLVGDNRPGSSDSRLWGPVTKTDIQGQISFVLWPIAKIRYVLRIDY